MEKLKIAMVGAGRRGAGGWLPVIAAFDDQLSLVGVCNRGNPRGEEAADQYHTRWYTHLEQMLDMEKPEVVAIAVNPAQTYEVAMPILERGISLVTETPVAAQLEQADAIIAQAQETGAKLEVAENLYRVPQERLKRQMILEGVFGKVWRGQNDNRTHNYHAVSLIRSYIGFDVPIVSVIGVQGEFSTAPHLYRGQPTEKERSRHASFKFANGALGFHSFSSLSFGSPLRGRSSTFFYAERGMGWDNELILLTGESENRSLRIERVTCEVDGQQILDKMVAGEFVWDNPFTAYKLSDGQISIASELMSIVEAVRDDKDPEYGALNGRIDREVDLAISRSHEQGSVPIQLPLK
ncbi:Gfo/Idh/MocA family oxidoreductase [Candidatus Poribacteria bacterium]|nr:Gfo/Idh/MocA family oxidoreductase [Candidatus Poribacteria bacterium]